MPLNQALFGFGDAVCVPAVEWVARALADAGRDGDQPMTADTLRRAIRIMAAVKSEDTDARTLVRRAARHVWGIAIGFTSGPCRAARTWSFRPAAEDHQRARLLLAHACLRAMPHPVVPTRLLGSEAAAELAAGPANPAALRRANWRVAGGLGVPDTAAWRQRLTAKIKAFLEG